MIKIKSFRRRILLSLLGIGLLPSLTLLALGTFAVRETVSSIGTAGAWGSAAESGRHLLNLLDSLGLHDRGLTEAARAHREALSRSLRFSQMVSFLGVRFRALLPVGLALLAGLIALLAFWAARQLSRGFSRPIAQLVEWTELIGRGEPLPPPGPLDDRGVEEFARLREALRTMAAKIEEGRAQAVQAAKLRSWTEMARRVAHELKNPLTPMQLAAVSLQRLNDPAAREAGQVLAEEIRRLDDMARAFSQFGRMPEGPPAPVDLVELLTSLARQHGGPDGGVAVTAQGRPRPVLGHLDALERTFRNLLVNAVEAAGPGGWVGVQLWEEGGWVYAEIRDSGPGIPPDCLEQIWEPDFTTKARGTGLGLALVRQTVQAHRGKVEARNHPGGGAVFLVALAVEPESVTPWTS